MEISNIDDLLMGGKTTTQPSTPENQYSEPEANEEIESGDDDYGNDSDEPEDKEDSSQSPDKSTSDNDENENSDVESQEDEYGNRKERMPKGMKERLDRKDKKHSQEIQQRDSEISALRAQLSQQGASSEVQKAAKDFEYDPNDDSSWQQQLSAIIKQTIAQEEQEKVTRHQQQEEQRESQEFRGRFEKGMDRFHDFLEVVSDKPVDSAMTMALRAIDDPAAFIYAASKRNPQELERISKIQSPNKRYAEMIRLEATMRKGKSTTKAPRPIARLQEDGRVPAPKSKKDDSIEGLIAASEARKLATMKARRGR